MKDHRSEVRVQSPVPIRQEPDGARLIDMSRSGISFITDREYAVGDPIDMHFFIGPGAQDDRLEFHCRGKVVRVEPDPDGWLVAGSIEWLD